MAFNGGPIESANISGREFAGVGDASVPRKLGGLENELLANGNRTVRKISTVSIPMFTGVQVAIDDNRGDQEFLQGIADGDSLVPVSVTYVSGVTYQGRMTISGELTFDNMTASATFDLAGEDKIVRQ